MRKKYNIRGMHCKSCEILLEKSISQINGVRNVEVNHRKGFADVEFINNPDDGGVARAIQTAGYSLGQAGELSWFSHDGETWMELVLGAAALLVLFMIGKATGVLDGIGGSFGSSPTYSVVFVIGLTAGISTCMAMVGGLVAGFAASYAEAHQYATRWQRFKPNLFFNLGRLISYTVLGGAIGALGSAVKLSSGFTGLLIIAAGIVMLYLGVKLTGISPKLANINFTLPKKIGKMFGVKESNGSYSHKEAMIGGALTFFLPCGFTQAMQIYAMTTGSFTSGAIIMFLFALGTLPGLLGIGALSSVFTGTMARIFFRFVGLVVLILGFWNIANGYNLSGIPFPSLSSGGDSAQTAAPVRIVDGEQIVNMKQAVNGYFPNAITIKKGIPVKWIIDSESSYTCAASIRMPAYNIMEALKIGENVITFTPTKTGPVRFTCGMGMYSGTFNVID